MGGNSRAGSAVKGSRMEKITRSDKALHALRLTTMLLLLIYGMMQKLSVFSFVCNNRKIPAVFLLLFFVVLLWDLFSKRRMFKGTYVWVLVGFLLTTVLSCLINIRYGYAKNVIGLSYLVAELAVLYPFSGYRETAKRDFRIIAYVVIAFSLLLSLYTYISYFLCLQYHIDAPIEGLIIDKNISFADLKGTLEVFAKELFGEDTKTKFRPHHFPFTEPSAEMDVSCFKCGGKGCRFCKGSGWIEILGCGMVHPHVLEMCGIDPEEYTGFAFGVGLERIALLKYEIDDMRLLYENDIRFLKQF